MATAKSVISYAKEALLDELYATAIYSKLAEHYEGRDLSRKFRELAEMEKNHAKFWSEFLGRREVSVEGVKVSRLKVSFWVLLFRILGLGLTFKILESSERKAIEMYSEILDSEELSSEEREALKKVLEDELIHEHTFAEEESRFKEFINHVRDAVLGMNDGLVEVLSVSAGLAGAYGDPLYVALGGLIVGVGGALSMGIGAFTSVRAQKQVRLGVLTRLRVAAKYAAHILIEKVTKYMMRRGLREETARVIAEGARRRGVLDKIVAEEEYGIREERLENPLRAGIYTGLFYAVGAFVPLTPYFAMMSVSAALPASFIMAAFMLGIMGFLIAITAELSTRIKVAELIIAGLGSATVTFAIGRLASALLGIEVG